MRARPQSIQTSGLLYVIRGWCAGPYSQAGKGLSLVVIPGSDHTGPYIRCGTDDQAYQLHLVCVFVYNFSSLQGHYLDILVFLSPIPLQKHKKKQTDRVRFIDTLSITHAALGAQFWSRSHLCMRVVIIAEVI
jgi:hypothetical protein